MSMLKICLLICIVFTPINILKGNYFGAIFGIIGLLFSVVGLKLEGRK